MRFSSKRIYFSCRYEHYVHPNKGSQPNVCGSSVTGDLWNVGQSLYLGGSDVNENNESTLFKLISVRLLGGGGGSSDHSDALGVVSDKE